MFRKPEMFIEAISELLVRRVEELGLFVERLESSRSILGDNRKGDAIS